MADIDLKAVLRDAEQAMVHPFEGMYNAIVGGDKVASNGHHGSSNCGDQAHFQQVKDTNTMAGSSGVPSDVKSPIADMKIPDGWNSSRTERGGIGQRALNEYSAPDGSGVTLSLYQEGLPLKAAAAGALAGVLAKGPHQLMPAEIVAVRDAIGYSNAGDNQYTDKNYQPAFNLTAAGVSRINEKDVLVVEGKYNNGGKSFRGVFAPFVDDSGATRVQQVFIEGSASGVAKNLNSFKSTVDSIKWNDAGTAPRSGESTTKNSPAPHNTGMIRDN